METWYQMTPIQYTWEIVEGNQCQLEELWIGKIHATKDRSSSMESSMISERSASTEATTASPTRAPASLKGGIEGG